MIVNHNKPFKRLVALELMVDEKVKIAVIAGAARALRYKERNPSAPEEEILQHIAAEMEQIVGKVDTAA